MFSILILWDLNVGDLNGVMAFGLGYMVSGIWYRDLTLSFVVVSARVFGNVHDGVKEHYYSIEVSVFVKLFFLHNYIISHYQALKLQDMWFLLILGFLLLVR